MIGSAMDCGLSHMDINLSLWKQITNNLESPSNHKAQMASLVFPPLADVPVAVCDVQAAMVDQLGRVDIMADPRRI